MIGIHYSHKDMGAFLLDFEIIIDTDNSAYWAPTNHQVSGSATLQQIHSPSGVALRFMNFGNP